MVCTWTMVWTHQHFWWIHAHGSGTIFSVPNKRLWCIKEYQDTREWAPMQKVCGPQPLCLGLFWCTIISVLRIWFPSDRYLIKYFDKNKICRFSLWVSTLTSLFDSCIFTKTPFIMPMYHALMTSLLSDGRSFEPPTLIHKYISNVLTSVQSYN